MKKRYWSRGIFTLFALSLALEAYDVRNKALVPVEFQRAPEHAPVPLVENGKPTFVIVTDKEAETRLHGKNKTAKSIAPAIEVLQEAFEKCTGTKPEVADVKDAAKYSRMIVVGDCSIAKENGVDVSKLLPQELEIKTFPQGIILAGNDSSLIEGYNMKPLEARGSSMGTNYAAYDFVERFLGVRYFFPGEFGTLWPKITELTIAPVHYTDHPRFDTRSGNFYLGDSIRTDASKKFWEPYMGKLRDEDRYFYRHWRMGQTIPGAGVHCPRPERLAQAYPDKLKTIFYTSPAGNFWYNSKQHIGNYFDVVNLEFADLLFDSMKKFYDSNGKIDEGAYQNHGCNLTYASFGMCDTLMPDTDVIHHPVVKKLQLMTPADLARGERAGMANIYARFHQYLAGRFQKELPGIKLYIMAYYNALYAGTDPRWKLPPNTEVNLCLGDLPTKTRNEKLMEENVQIAKEWYDSLGGRPIQKLWLYDVRDNAFVKAVAGEFVGDIPKIFGKYLGRTSLFYDHNCNGPGNIWFYYTSAYCAYRSMWNPEWDAEAGIDEHWEPFYGKEAGGYLRQFHKLVKDCYLKYSVPQTDKNPIYPVPELVKMEKLLAQAQAAIQPGTVEEQRFKLFSAPWPKAIQAMKNQISYERPVHLVYQLLRDEQVTIDGQGLEAFWEKVKAMPFMDPKGSSDKPKYPVSVKLAWDKTGIYGLLETPYAPKAETKNDVWKNCNYELFFSPGMKRENEYQFAFDALKNLFLGTQRHLPIPQPFDSYWKAPGFKFESVYDSQKWTVELFIPFSVFNADVPNPYDIWFCNVVCNKNSEPKEYSGTSMTLGNNHNMTMYGMIKFAGKGD